MNRERVTQISIAAGLLFVGWLIGQWSLSRPDAHFLTRQSEVVYDAFRTWFWERRGLDLAVQVGLIFVGALGITALLPENSEIHNTEEHGLNDTL